MAKIIKRIQVPFTLKQNDIDSDGDYFYFKGYASTFGNIDCDSDVIVKGAFSNSINEIKASGNNLPVLWSHNMSIPLGIYTLFEEDEKGLYVEAKLPKEDEFVKNRIIPQIKVGSVRKMSIGFFIKDSHYETRDGKSIRMIKEVELFEISLVTIPANSQADVTGFKGATPYQDLPLADRERPWSKEDALGRVRLFTSSTEEPSKDYKKAFFYYDENNQDLYGSYKLPYADIIDGELRAVPRAIFASAAAIRGARGGVDIPEEDKMKVIANINKYYAKMRKEFNDDSIVSRFEEDTKSLIENAEKLSDIENIFKKHYFTNKESQMLISKVTELKKLGDHADKVNKGDEPLLSEAIEQTFKEIRDVFKY